MKPTPHARRSTRSVCAAAACAAVFGLAAPGVESASVTGNLVATLTLTASCVVVGAAGTATSVNLGTLAFGSQPSTFTGLLNAVPTAGASGSGNTQVLCSPDVSGLAISVDGGANPGQGTAIGTGTRAMRNGTAFVPYEVYRDSNRTTAYPISTALTGFAVPPGGTPLDLPIFGQVNKTSAVALPSGAYTDTLVVTLTF